MTSGAEIGNSLLHQFRCNRPDVVRFALGIE